MSNTVGQVRQNRVRTFLGLVLVVVVGAIGFLRGQRRAGQRPSGHRVHPGASWGVSR
ncbi:hypothetical protein [Streptosporangium vulgare]|uniref:hypothetical protein n=1 Tax=Streptosporangium vulgare TaxID=46190 RepID=UPI0031E26E9A